MNKGTVLSVSRPSGTAQVSLLGGPTVAASYLNAPPPPRSVVFVEDVGNGSWLILGAIGDMRTIWHDDFCRTVTQVSDVGYALYTAGAGSAVGGDTTLGTGVATKVGIVGPFTDALLNSFISLVTDSSAQIPSSGALWMSGCIAMSALAGTLARFGWGDTPTTFQFSAAGGTTRMAVLSFDSTVSATNWLLVTFNGATSTTVDTGVAATANQYIWFDLVLRPGTSATLWIDGNQVAQSTTNLPVVGDLATSPGFGIFNRTAAARAMRVDVLQVVYFAFVQ